MFFKIVVMVLVLFGLSGCNGNNGANQSNDDRSSKRFGIKMEPSANQEGENLTQESLPNNESDLNQQESAEEKPAEQDKDVTPPPQEDTGTKEGQNSEQKDGSQEKEVDKNVISFIPIDEFRNRWNAISDSYTGENYIRSFEQTNTENDSYYHASLNNQTELRVFINEKQYVNRIRLIGKSGTVHENFAILASWWQLLLLTNPELTDFDLSFSHIGVGPNADLSGVKELTFTLGGTTFHVVPEGQIYTFEAIFP